MYLWVKLSGFAVAVASIMPQLIDEVDWWIVSIYLGFIQVRVLFLFHLLICQQLKFATHPISTR